MKALAVVLILSLSGCSAIAGLGIRSLTGGGPSLDVQAGKENTRQNVGIQAGRDNVSGTSAEKIENVNIQQVPTWMLIALMLAWAWFVPSPKEIWREIKPTRKKKEAPKE